MDAEGKPVLLRGRKADAGKREHPEHPQRLGWTANVVQSRRLQDILLLFGHQAVDDIDIAHQGVLL